VFVDRSIGITRVARVEVSDACHIGG
jgi:hypothetical protein